MLYVALLILAVPIAAQESTRFGTGSAQIGPFRISIQNEGEPIGNPVTSYENLGPQLGGILNAHYFPGLKLYEAARYREAYDQLTYVIDRPAYLNGNANQAVYLTTAYYMRGMIFLYHASGPGRLTLAKNDFEMAIRYNDKNYPAYLELSRVLSTAGSTDQAAVVLRYLIGLEPDREILERAESELMSLGAESK